jgi:hypothetical protein
MKRLIIGLVTIGVLASLAQAAISGSVVVSPRNYTVIASTGAAGWCTGSGYTGDVWRDRPGYMAIEGLATTDTFMAQSTYGGEVRTTITGLTPGLMYNFWVLFSVSLSPTTGLAAKSNNLNAAFRGSSTLTTYGVASPYPSITMLPGTTNTGLVSRNEGTAIWTVMEGDLGTAIADANGMIGMRVDYPDGSDRTLWNAVAYLPLNIAYLSPARNATNVPVVLSAPGNDLNFKVDDAAITKVDVYLSTSTDPTADGKIVDQMPVTLGTYNVDLVGEVASDLTYDTTYYWKLVGYEPNSTTNLLDVKFNGPVYKFKTVPASPIITVAPAKLGYFMGESATITATASNYDTLQWYKDGSILSNGSKYSGVTTLALGITGAALSDAGNYYCVATKTVTSMSVSSNACYLYQKKLISHWSFESTYVADGNSYTPDVAGGRDAELMYGATVVTGTTADSVIGGFLKLDNPTNVNSNSTPTGGQWAFIHSDPNVVKHQNLTISAWYRPADPQNSDSRIVEFSRNSSNWVGLLAADGSRMPGFTIDSNSVSTTVRSTRSVALGGWHYLVATVDTTVTTNQASLYLDGNLIRQGAWAGTIELMLPTNSLIGRTRVGSNGFFNGLVDEVKVYNFVQTLTDIRRDYLLGAPYICADETYAAIKAYDFNGDCRITFADYAIFSQNWLSHARLTSIP